MNLSYYKIDKEANNLRFMLFNSPKENSDNVEQKAVTVGSDETIRSIQPRKAGVPAQAGFLIQSATHTYPFPPSQDYFVLVPNEYYEPRLLNEDVYDACLAGEQLPYCRQYSYPDITQFPTGWSDGNARRPGGSNNDVYAWGDRPEVLGELGTRKLATVARWQPQLEYEVPLQERKDGRKEDGLRRQLLKTTS